MSAWYWGLSEQEWDKLVADTELYNNKVKAGLLPSPSDRGSRLGMAGRRQQGPSLPSALALAHWCPESTADFSMVPFQQAQDLVPSAKHADRLKARERATYLNELR